MKEFGKIEIFLEGENRNGRVENIAYFFDLREKKFFGKESFCQLQAELKEGKSIEILKLSGCERWQRFGDIKTPIGREALKHRFPK